MYISKDFDAAVDYLAKEARKSKMAMVHTLLETGMTYYIGDKIAEYNKRVIAAGCSSKNQSSPVSSSS